MAKDKRTDERAALAEAILPRNDAEAARDKHVKAYTKAAALVKDAEAEVVEATVALNEANEAGNAKLVDAIYGDAAAEPGVSSAARQRLEDAQDALRTRRGVLAVVEEKKAEAEEVVKRLEKDVERAARAVVEVVAAAALERAFAAEEELWRARFTLRAAAHVSADPMKGPRTPAQVHASHINPHDMPVSQPGGLSQSDRHAIEATWRQAFATLKRDADAALPGEASNA